MSKVREQNGDAQDIREDNYAHLKKTHRHSLQPKSSSELPLSSLRHTQSHRYDSGGRKSKKKVKVQSPIQSIILDIPEEEEPEEGDKKEKKSKKTSVSQKIATKAALAYDNECYDGNSDRASGSFRVGSSRASSIQSLEVVREQYCCCVRRTKCERKLLITVTIMSIVIIVLIIVIAVISSRNDINVDLKHTWSI